MNSLYRLEARVSAMVIILALLFAGAACDRRAAADPRKELDPVAAAFNIDIVARNPVFPISTTYGPIDGRSAVAQDLENYAALFASEFRLYPPDLIKRAELKTVVLCSELSYAGQLRNAVPDFEHDVLYLDVSRGNYDTSYLREVIHHEFFHIIDYRDDGELYEDKQWKTLNPPGFKYGNGGKEAQSNSQSSVLTDKYPGFLNYYSTTGVEEDKAEVFANMIVNWAYLDARIARDPVIKSKAKRMKELVAQFCPDMNDAFWEKVRKIPRDGE